MMRQWLVAALAACLLAPEAWGEARQVSDFHWQGARRVVVVGDLHGDYEQYLKVMRAAGLLDKRGKWSGGDAHLVQTGDIPDRGPDSRKIIDHLIGLAKQAQRKDGRVHTLIGNHEAMNTYGDLRYVDSGEFDAFTGRNSERLRELQWEAQLQRIREVKPEEFLVMDLDQYRQEWEQQVPLGWVEHRLAWQPAGEYGQWVMANPTVIQVNDTLFLHGGISAKYCRYTLAEINAMVRGTLENFDPLQPGVVEDPDGPLWYRGLAEEDEVTLRPVVDAILERYGARRIVVGHTPTGGIVWPRFGGRVVVNDTGIAAYYGGHDAYLELNGAEAMAGYGERRLALPTSDADRIAYLQEVVGSKPDNRSLQARLASLLAPPPEPAASGVEEPPAVEQAPVSQPLPLAPGPGMCE